MSTAEHAAAQAHSHRHGHEPPAPGKATDPVCGMSVDPATARHRATHAGREYFFCGARCRERFIGEPERFAGDQPAPPPAAREGALWTCPMHPEIVRKGPESCPICGMALEPMTPAAGEESNPELADMTRRFRVGAVFSAPLLILAMGEHLVSDWHHALTSQPAIWAQFVLATPVVLWCGAPFFQRGWQSVVNRHLNMFTLIALGTGIAYLYSLAATVAPGIFPDTFSNCAPAPGHPTRSARCSTSRQSMPV
jgi:YHS domain-containing protein